MSRRGVFPFRFRGSCRLEPGLDGEVAPEIVQGEVAPEIVQSAGGFDEGVLKARFEVAVNVTLGVIKPFDTLVAFNTRCSEHSIFSRS